jgi:hypothetical protein
MEGDFFNDLQNYKPEITKDEEGFAPIKGKYVCRIAKINHNIGVSTRDNSPYDFYNMDLQVTETIDGDKGDRRYFRKRYNNDIDGIKKLMNDLFTAGILFDQSSRESFDLSLPSMIDQQVKIRAWTWTPDKDMKGNLIPEENRVAKQQFIIVKNFQKDKKAEGSSVPF